MDPVKKYIENKIKEVWANREEIMEAFLAKYGFEPDRAIQVEQRMPDGTTRWFLRRRTDQEMEELSLIGANL